MESDSTGTCWLAAQAPHLLWLPTATLLWAVREHQCINILSGHRPLWPQPQTLFLVNSYTLGVGDPLGTEALPDHGGTLSNAGNIKLQRGTWDPLGSTNLRKGNLVCSETRKMPGTKCESKVPGENSPKDSPCDNLTAAQKADEETG